MFHRLTQVILSTSKSRRATSLVSAGKIISVTLVAIWFAYPLTLIISACRWWPSGSLFIAALLDSAGSIAWLERRLHRNGLHSIDILKRKFKQEDALRSFVRANVEPRFHATESLPATSLIDANFEAISAELLDHADRGRSGFRNAYDNAWMPVQPSIGRTITVTRRFSTQQLKAGRHLRRFSTWRLKCLPPSLMTLRVDSLRLKRALERVERLLDHDGSFIPEFRTKVVQQRDGVLIQPDLHRQPPV